MEASGTRWMWAALCAVAPVMRPKPIIDRPRCDFVATSFTLPVACSLRRLPANPQTRELSPAWPADRGMP